MRLSSASSGNINVVTPRLIVQNGGSIVSKTFSPAQGGNITLDVSELIEVNGFSEINPEIFSTIASITLADGKSGGISVSTLKLSVLDGAIISTTTFGNGDSGNLSINAQILSVKGSGLGLFGDSTIASSNECKRNGW